MIDHSELEAWDRLTRLLGPFHRAAHATARRLAASQDEGDDLFQDALIHAHKKLAQLRDEAKFRSWFFAILLSKHRSRSRRAFWKRFVPLDSAEEPQSGSMGDSEWLAAWRMRHALQGLPSVERETLVLHEIDGFSTDEVADITGVAPGTVRSRLSRSRARIRRIYLRRGWIEGSRAPEAIDMTTIHEGRP